MFKFDLHRYIVVTPLNSKGIIIENAAHASNRGRKRYAVGSRAVILGCCRCTRDDRP